MARHNLETGTSSVQWVGVGGDDAQNGQVSSEPKASLAAAHTALPAGGGAIFVLPGTVVANNVVFTKPVKLEGAGPAGSVVLSITTTDATGVTLSGDGATNSAVRDLCFQDDVVGDHARTGLQIDGAQDITLDSLWFNNIGDGDTAGQAAATRPAGLRITGDGSYADWIKLVNSKFRNCYTGLLIEQDTSGANGFVSNCDFYGSAIAEHIYHNGGDAWSFSGLWLASGPSGGYQVRLVDGGGCKFTGVNCELSAAAAPGDHFFHVGTSRNLFANVFMNGGGHLSTVTPDAAFFAAGTVDNQVVNWMTRDNGQGAGIFRAADATAASNNYVMARNKTAYAHTVST